jgi:hypothetical protein
MDKKAIFLRIGLITLVCISLVYGFGLLSFRVQAHLWLFLLLLLIGCVFLVAGLSFDFLGTYVHDYAMYPDIKSKKKEDPQINAHNLFELLLKLRGRSIVANNYAVIVLVFTVLVISFGFYEIVNVPNGSDTTTNLLITKNISASAMLVLLVQILFRVFKYLIRVAAFYNGKADALEYLMLSGSTDKNDLKSIMEMFTPDAYDISEVSGDNVLEYLKAKFQAKPPGP